jgi:hypothetical protein
MLEVRRAMRRKRIFRDRTNPLEKYMMIEKVVLLEEYEKRKVILKAKFSSSITSGDKNRAWQEIANIVNAGNSVKREKTSDNFHLRFPLLSPNLSSYVHTT